MAVAARRGVFLIALLIAALLGSHAERLAVRPHVGRARVGAKAAAAILAVAGGLGVRAQEEAEVVFVALDVNADGALSREEFSAIALPGATHLEGEEQRGPFLRKTFGFADLDGDGALTEAEARYAHFVANIAFSPSTSRDRSISAAKSVVASYDRDGDGLLNEGEYRAWVVAQADGWGMDVGSTDFASWAAGAFSSADITGDRHLMAKEVHYAMFLHEQAQQIMEEAICGMMARMLVLEHDADGDGRLSGEETEALVRRTAGYPGDSARERVFRFFFAAGFEDGLEVGASKAPSADVSAVADLRALFASADIDGDGSIDIEEMAQLTQRLTHEFR